MDTSIFLKPLAVVGIVYAALACRAQWNRIVIDPFHPRLAYRILICFTLFYPLISSSLVDGFDEKTKWIILIAAFFFLLIIDIADALKRPAIDFRTLYNDSQQDPAVANLFLFVFIGGWIWRVFALQVGLLQGTFLATQLETTDYGNFVGQLNNLSLIGFFGWLIFHRAHSVQKWIYLMFLLEIVWAFISGSKIAIFYVMFPAAIIFFQRGWFRPNLKGFVVGAIIGVIVLQVSFALVTSYRIGVQVAIARGSDLSVAAIADGATQAFELIHDTTTRESDESVNPGVSGRLNWAMYFGSLLERPDLTKKLWMGSTLIPIFAWWIPRFLWENKPTVSIGAWYGENVLGWTYQTRSEGAITIWGDGYLNFGLVGVAVFSMIWVVITYYLYEKLQKKGGWGLLVLSLVYVRLLLGLEQNIAAPLVAFQLQLLVIWGIWVVANRQQKNVI
ncbi:hypothetical protein [Amphibiibacter pelophylacis]|uniref:Uncharacterized protein n=1 Tax=Amphibiibacter pelophylacis TaxID=1799477 RepID=A0ACC6NZA0_9BURK